MAVRKLKPTSAGRRAQTVSDFAEITRTTPERSLVCGLTRKAGRNNVGHETMRRRGGGHKRLYRIIDFKREKQGIEATVSHIEYDPNRTCRIALIEYKDGEKSYILAPTGLQVGMKVESGQKVAPKVGNAMPLKNVPLGTSVHNIEIRPGSGGKVARAAGQQAIVSNREAGYALIKMPSGEIRRFNEDCYCTIGQVGNTQHMNEMSGKAGRTRWMGVRPTVRGMTMNPVDHPNGGGEGKSKSGGGRQHLKSPWGHVKGQKTRRLRKPSDSVIVQRRNAK